MAGDGDAIGELLAALTSLTEGVCYPSEEDAPVRVVDLGVADAPEIAVEREAPGAVAVDTADILAAPLEGGFGEEFPEDGAKLARAVEILRAACGGVTAFRASSGSCVARVFVLGRHASGHVVGLETRVVAS